MVLSVNSMPRALIILHVVVFFLMFQRTFVEGITLGSVK